MTRIRLIPLAAVCLCLVAGCSSGNKAAPARVTGKVTYDGKPITAGVMNFYTADGVPYSGLINSNGTYTATDLPTGEMVVTVETESMNPNKKAPEGAEAKKRMGMMQQAPPGGAPAPTHRDYLKIPAKYADKKTSPLKATLAAGNQSKDFDLTD